MEGKQKSLCRAVGLGGGWKPRGGALAPRATVPGWPRPFPFLSHLLLPKLCQDLWVLCDTERNAKCKLVFFLTVSAGGTKPNTKKVLLIQHGGKNADFVLRWS